MNVKQQKEIGIIIFVSLYTVLMYLAVVLLVRQWFTSIGIIVAISIFIWVAMMSAVFALVHNNKAAKALLILIPPIIVAIAGAFSIPALVGAVLLAIMLLAASRSIHEEIESRIKMKMKSVFWSGARIITLGCIISLMTLYFPVMQNMMLNDEFGIPQEYISLIMKPLKPIIGQYVPGIESSDSTIDEMIETQMLQEGIELSQKDMENVRQDIASQMGMSSISGEDTLETLVASKINGYLSNFTGQGDIVFIITTLIIGILTIRLIIPLLMIPIMLLIVFFLYLSRTTGLIQIEHEQVTAEKLKL